VNPHQKAAKEARRVWALLEGMSEEERKAVVDDKGHEYWETKTSVHLSCWVCRETGLSIIYDQCRFEGIAVPRVHNFYTNAKRMDHQIGVLKYRDNWTDLYHPEAYERRAEIIKGMKLEAA
jgi:hypothetical protein